MDFNEIWNKALRKTEIVRPRVVPLATHNVTRLPYICLSESAINPGDTAVRRGEVIVERPSIVLPYNTPQFEGFDFERGMRVNEELFKSFLLVRGVQFPGMKYNNKSHSLDVHDGALSRAIDYFKRELQKTENVHTGLIAAPEDCWQFSVLLFICSQVARSADNDFKRLFDDMHRFERS
jgi:hypothetical protein